VRRVILVRWLTIGATGDIGSMADYLATDKKIVVTAELPRKAGKAEFFAADSAALPRPPAVGSAVASGDPRDRRKIIMRPHKYDKTSLPRHSRGGLFMPLSRRGWNYNPGYKKRNRGSGVSWFALILRTFALLERWSEK